MVVVAWIAAQISPSLAGCLHRHNQCPSPRCVITSSLPCAPTRNRSNPHAFADSPDPTPSLWLTLSLAEQTQQEYAISAARDALQQHDEDALQAHYSPAPPPAHVLRSQVPTVASHPGVHGMVESVSSSGAGYPGVVPYQPDEEEDRMRIMRAVNNEQAH